jgi:predicted alpha-1,6-mannanase (GH76 family)
MTGKNSPASAKPAAILLLRLLNELERLRRDAVLQIEWMMRGAALVLEQAFERDGFRDRGSLSGC